MKPTHKTALRVLFVFILIAVLVGIFTPAKATGRYTTINNYYTTNEYTSNYYDDDSGVSDSELDSDISMMMAADAIHCTTSTRKNQVGVGTGYRSGKNGYAVGYCKTIDNSGTPMMLGIKAAGASGRSPAYGVGLNFTF